MPEIKSDDKKKSVGKPVNWETVDSPIYRHCFPRLQRNCFVSKQFQEFIEISKTD